ncbi:tRNA (guanine(26)-N(2)/guanine(27)-N(2))-dimethyltransferase isoform X2 [Phalaenopsis equestris]|uniref:tRNA (guanine(26)-N(2)/guanine(27)-N(2))-dimethyltransferase isoform X2 n=1 Tax=Phalaenopsis equestris TaxID=78828 RepID=UPI0009E3D83C|nr:tRNA (guanine(26)-N(2)/guanine(27)-N(2))-dimethyltransferase isoform X2 [Phalaenopsis equestris]
MLSSPRVGFQNLPHVLSSASLSPLPRTAKSFCQRKPLFISSSKVEERGIEFETGDSFFRHESAVGRDLSVLAAALQRRSIGRGLRVIDAMCGCGVRSLRYLVQSEADFVWANDAFEGHRGLIASNLSSVVPRVSAEGGRRWVVTHYDANRLLAGRYLQGEYFDLVDVDSFGSDSSFIRSAIATVKIGGLLYCTSTDGFSSGGHRPQHSLSSYGAYVRPMPYSNEVGLRMLIGGASREAAALGFLVSPLFSCYSYHGPVFRVMLQVFRGNLNESSNYGFISYCNQCGHSQTYQWGELGQISCPCRNGMVSHSVVVSGPLWIGPLHNTDYVCKMLELAREWGWACNLKKCSSLESILTQMIAESDPQLPPGYIKLDELVEHKLILLLLVQF